MAKHRKGHGIHSPYAFRFVNQVIYEQKEYYSYSGIEKFREKLLKDQTVITTPAIGTQTSAKQQTVREIARRCCKPRKQAQLLHRICVDCDARTILELGTNLGITTLYLANVNRSDSKVYTFEGSQPLAKLARKHFKENGCENIEIIEGNIDDTLLRSIEALDSVDFVFFDANHTYDATISYFDICKRKAHNKTIFVFDDIYKSEGMKRAWEKIISSEETTMSMDLYCFGIVWFDKNLPKQNFEIAY